MMSVQKVKLILCLLKFDLYNNVCGLQNTWTD